MNVMAMDMSYFQNMQIVGLAIDATGIAILGIPAMFRMSKEIAA